MGIAVHVPDVWDAILLEVAVDALANADQAVFVAATKTA
jgi:hypothetical protein